MINLLAVTIRIQIIWQFLVAKIALCGAKLTRVSEIKGFLNHRNKGDGASFATCFWPVH